MKKLISIIMSIVAVVAMSTAFAVPAMAAVNVYSPKGEAIVHQANSPLVNKQTSVNVSGKQQTAGSNVITFTYSGTDGTLKGWNLIDKNGNTIELDKNSKSYKIVSQEGNTLVLEILDWDYFESPDGYTVNAVVEGASSEASKKDDSSKSPSTGAVSVAIASVAAAGAGAAALTLLKKKDAE